MVVVHLVPMPKVDLTDVPVRPPLPTNLQKQKVTKRKMPITLALPVIGFYKYPLTPQVY